MGCDWGYPLRSFGAAMYRLHSCSEIPGDAYSFEIRLKSCPGTIWIPTCVLSVSGIAVNGHSLLLFGCQSICPGCRMDCFWHYIGLFVGLSESLGRTIADRNRNTASYSGRSTQLCLIEARRLKFMCWEFRMLNICYGSSKHSSISFFLACYSFLFNSIRPLRSPSGNLKVISHSITAAFSYILALPLYQP